MSDARTDADYAQWSQMKRRGFWRWVLIDSVSGMWPESLIGPTVMTVSLGVALFNSFHHSKNDFPFWLALCFTAFFQVNLWMDAMIRWRRLKKSDDACRAALAEDAAA